MTCRPTLPDELRALAQDSRRRAQEHRVAAELADEIATGIELVLARHERREERQRSTR